MTFSTRAAFQVALFCFSVAVVFGPRPVCAGSKFAHDTLVIETQTGRQTFDIEVAKTDREKARGLMFRTGLASGRGMLFPYDKPMVVSMWMRNTYISLDMIFIGTDGRITRIVERTEPLSETIFSSHGDVMGVLEIAAGEAARLKLQKGDKVRHAHFGTALRN